MSESKKHEKSASELLELRQMKDQLQSSIKSSEEERGNLYQRLAASQETLMAQEKELQAKERRYIGSFKRVPDNWITVALFFFILVEFLNLIKQCSR